MTGTINTSQIHRLQSGEASTGDHRTLPTYSVIIPCYNGAAWLADALESVLNQTVDAWEVIVVDDGSTAPGLEQIRQNVTDGRIRWLGHVRNRGLSAARNTGFRAARADLILPMDADDRLAPTFLETLGANLADNPGADCVFSDFQCFGHCQDRWRFSVRDAEAMTKEQWIPGPGTLMRKRLWQSVGGYCTAEALLAGNEDWDFGLGVIEQGVRAIHVAEPLYRYQRHADSMATRLMRVDWRTREFIYQRHLDLFDQFGTGSSFRAKGYRNSAEAASSQGLRLKAAYLSLRAWWLSPLKKPNPEAIKTHPTGSIVSIPSGASV